MLIKSKTHKFMKKFVSKFLYFIVAASMYYRYNIYYIFLI